MFLSGSKYLMLEAFGTLPRFTFCLVAILLSPRVVWAEDILLADCGVAVADYSLHDAAKIGDLVSIDCLISAGQDINQVNTIGMTPLAVAAAYGQERVVESLVLYADLNLGKRPPVQAALSSLSIDEPANFGEQRSFEELSMRFRLVRLIVEAGADVRLPEPPGVELFPSLVVYGCFGNTRAMRHDDGRLILDFANLAQLVADAGANLEDERLRSLFSLLQYPLDELMDRKCMETIAKIVFQFDETDVPPEL